MAATLDLSEETLDRGFELLEELRDRNLARGRGPGELTGAILYLVSREQHDPRTLQEASIATGSDKKSIGKTYRYIARNTDRRIVPPEPGDFVGRFADELVLPDSTKKLALDLVERAREQDFTSGKSPRGIAASAVYIAAFIEGERRSMKEVSDVLGVTTVTIRERSREFVEELRLDKYPGHLDG